VRTPRRVSASGTLHIVTWTKQTWTLQQCPGNLVVKNLQNKMDGLEVIGAIWRQKICKIFYKMGGRWLAKKLVVNDLQKNWAGFCRHIFEYTGFCRHKIIHWKLFLHLLYILNGFIFSTCCCCCCCCSWFCLAHQNPNPQPDPPIHHVECSDDWERLLK